MSVLAKDSNNNWSVVAGSPGAWKGTKAAWEAGVQGGTIPANTVGLITDDTDNTENGKVYTFTTSTSAIADGAGWKNNIWSTTLTDLPIGTYIAFIQTPTTHAGPETYVLQMNFTNCSGYLNSGICGWSTGDYAYLCHSGYLVKTSGSTSSVDFSIYGHRGFDAGNLTLMLVKVA